MDTDHPIFQTEYKTFSDFEEDSVFEITQVQIKDTVNGSMGLVEYNHTDAKGETSGMLMVPKRFMDSSPDTLSAPYIIVYRGKKETPGVVNWFYDLRLVVLSAAEKMNVGLKAASIRRMSKTQRDAYFHIRSLSSFEVGSVVVYTSLRMHHFVNNTTACVASYKTEGKRGGEEGEVFVPDRYKETLLSSMPGIFICRGLRDNRKTSGHPYHDINVLKVEAIAGLSKLCIDDDADGFSESDDFDAGGVMENPLGKQLKGKRMI